ncbi:DUF4326 domain-containing protein [Leptothoe spongobia]|uniref:DUF4326 domain-containing protein n=1 Tax=Leptothoe spongobia TAU-MAC 1115 TaxID=1967444 RepID=A0A947DH24_9CYAN|nr:DUF4326 domain-containing protein [Leptothoe spongobia]MBT9316259.1 DUF4326 domain-containing protein [Leptothoe spongobia TAU-MAC 1115]
MAKLTKSPWLNIPPVSGVTVDRIENAIAWLRGNKVAIASHLPLTISGSYFGADWIDIFFRQLWPLWEGEWRHHESLGAATIYIFSAIGELRKELGAKPELKGIEPALSPLQVLNVKHDPGLFDRTDVEYIGRQYRMKSGRVIEASPLANDFVIGRDGNRADVCRKCREHQIQPAMVNRVGITYGELKRLAKKYLAGELTAVACWCTQPDQFVECHGHDVVSAIHTLAKEINGVVAYKSEKYATPEKSPLKIPKVRFAITLHRPWPYAIASLNKRLENRGWQPSGVEVGDWFAVHAGAKWDKDGAQWIKESGLGEVPPEEEHPRGVILLAKYGGISEGLLATSDPWFVGPLAWQIDDVIVFPEPIPHTQGRQKLWALPVHIQRQIAEMEVPTYAAA